MDNIRYGNNEVSDEAVIEAAKTVCAHDFIMETENGYYTQVNERGSGWQGFIKNHIETYTSDSNLLFSQAIPHECLFP